MNVLITGSTGFVGSSLAAQLLAAGHNVASLDRNDQGGHRSSHAVQLALTGLGFNQQGEHHPFQWEPTNLLETQSALRNISQKFGEINVVIHSAAEMTYSLSQVLLALSYNQSLTATFYEEIHHVFPRCQRFYYISTAYSSGPHSQIVDEKLCAKPLNVNSYQLSKWASEQSLFIQKEHLGMPVTILRPSIVIGSQLDGWATEQTFGFYMFLGGFMMLKEAGFTKIELDLRPENFIHLLPINQFTKSVELLLSKDQKVFEIFNCVPAETETLQVSQILSLVQEEFGMEITCSQQLNALGRRLDRMIQPNKLFANHPWKFESSGLKKHIHWPPNVQKEDIRNVVAHYAKSRAKTERQNKRPQPVEGRVFI